MSSARLRLNHTFTFGVGMLVVLACLFFSGMVESRGPACSMGLGRPEIYMPYEGTSYGWPVTAVQVGQIACQGPPEAWTPKPFIAWHANGVLISGVQMLAGGLLTLVIGGRLFSAAGGHG
jgi:hypothetical protein